jgi:hypothetical protein
MGHASDGTTIIYLTEKLGEYVRHDGVNFSRTVRGFGSQVANGRRSLVAEDSTVNISLLLDDPFTDILDARAGEQRARVLLR